MKTVQCLCAIVILLLSGSSAQEAEVTVTCNFIFTQQTVYTCSLSSLVIADEADQTFIFDVSGHLEGRTNDDVMKIEVFGGDVPFIVAELFETFPNVRFYTTSFAGLRRIQSNAFADAGNLETFISFTNPLVVIEPNAFLGAEKLTMLDFDTNEIEKIAENAFDGLTALEILNLSSNKIYFLYYNTFSKVNHLTYILLSDNQIETLDGRLFSENPLLRDVSFYGNQINAIDSNFFDGLDQLLQFDMRFNICADANWVITGETTIDTVRQGLQSCFDNAATPPPDDVRKFVLELRGSLILRDEDGNEVLRL